MVIVLMSGHKFVWKTNGSGIRMFSFQMVTVVIILHFNEQLLVGKLYSIGLDQSPKCI
jgi:hypothetical protein